MYIQVWSLCFYIQREHSMRRSHACGALAVTPEGPLHSQSPGGLSCGGFRRGSGPHEHLSVSAGPVHPDDGTLQVVVGMLQGPRGGEPDTAVLDTGCPPLRLSWCCFYKDNEIVPPGLMLLYSDVARI